MSAYFNITFRNSRNTVLKSSRSCYGSDVLCSMYKMKWTASSEFGTYRLCEQRRFRRACASAQSRQNLRCSLIQAVNQEEPSDRKPDPWPLWIAGHAQFKFVMTECSKTQIRLTGLKCEAPQKILVGIMVYGTKLEAQEQCVYGTADCVKTSIICCSYNEADLFTPFQEYDRVTISKQCNGQEAGSRFAPRLSRHPYSSYVVMNYTCMYGDR